MSTQTDIVTLDELTRLMLERVRKWVPAGTLPERYDPPPLPGDLTLPAKKSLEHYPHFCERDPVVQLPIVLVVPRILLYANEIFVYYGPDRDFEPYWIGPVVVVHDGYPRLDEQKWRPTTVVENAAGLCEYPWVGSLRSLDSMWAAQVFLCMGEIMGRMGGSGLGHHVAWAPQHQVAKPQSGLRKVDVAKK